MVAMRRLIDINLLDDHALQADMAMNSLWIVLIGTLLGVFGAAVFEHEAVAPVWFVLLIVVSVAVLPVHELVHAAAFKLVSGGSARIQFGFSSWMLYTSSPGTTLPRRRFCVVLLSPTVLVTLALAIVSWMCGWPLLGWFLAIVHLAGCTGDIGYARVIASERECSHVQDTDRGIALLCDDDM